MFIVNIPHVYGLFETSYDGLNHIHSLVSFQDPLSGEVWKILHLPYESEQANGFLPFFFVKIREVCNLPIHF